MKVEEKQELKELICLVIGLVLFSVGFYQAYDMAIRVYGHQSEYLHILAIQSTSLSKVITSLVFVLFGSIFITAFASKSKKVLYKFAWIYIPLTVFSILNIRNNVGGDFTFREIFEHSDPGMVVTEYLYYFYVTFIWILLLVPVLFWVSKVLQSILYEKD